MNYAYLTKRRLIDKTEDFIEKAASKSSFSDRAYQIKCRDGKTISSAKWLADELQRYCKKTRGSKRHTATRALLGEAAYSRE